MTNYVLSQIQLKYGPSNLARYQAAAATVQEFFEAANIKLVVGTITTVGSMYEVFNLWQTEDQGHLERVLHGISPHDSRARAAMAELSAVVQHEQLRFLEALPFGDSGHPQ
jgi:hypothetical protein